MTGSGFREQISASSVMQKCLQCMFQLLLFSCLEVVVKGTNVRLQPTDIKVDIGSWATFKCNVSCEFSQSHTITWFVGDSPNSRRLVDEDFEQRTGIQVHLQDIITCGAISDQRMAQQHLSVNVTSVERLNRTAVQCAALRKGPNQSDLYSHYGVILINDEPKVPTTTSESMASMTIEPSVTGTPTTSYISMESTRLLKIEPSHCPTAMTVIVSETVMVTVTQTVTVTNTPQAAPPPEFTAALNQSNGTSQKTASFVLALFLITLSLTIKLG